MQSSGNIHHAVSDMILPKSDFILNDFQSFHPCKCMLDSDSNLADLSVDALLQVRDLSIPWFFVG